MRHDALMHNTRVLPGVTLIITCAMLPSPFTTDTAKGELRDDRTCAHACSQKAQQYTRTHALSARRLKQHHRNISQLTKNEPHFCPASTALAENVSRLKWYQSLSASETLLTSSCVGSNMPDGNATSTQSRSQRRASYAQTHKHAHAHAHTQHDGTRDAAPLHTLARLRLVG
jgi:hypothetical protein